MSEADAPNPDVRWKQRFSNYKKALRQFDGAVIISKDFDVLMEKESKING